MATFNQYNQLLKNKHEEIFRKCGFINNNTETGKISAYDSHSLWDVVLKTIGKEPEIFYNSISTTPFCDKNGDKISDEGTCEYIIAGFSDPELNMEVFVPKNIPILYYFEVGKNNECRQANLVLPFYINNAKEFCEIACQVILERGDFFNLCNLELNYILCQADGDSRIPVNGALSTSEINTINFSELLTKDNILKMLHSNFITFYVTADERTNE